MHAERDHLVRVVFPELAERMAARRVHLRPVDLRWGVLSEEDSLDVCLDVIEECRPFFVGLLGERYGSVVPPASVPRARFEALLQPLDPAGRERLEAAYRLDPFLDAHVRTAAPIESHDLVALLERGGLEEAGLSITAMEVFRGVLTDPRSRMIRFFYFRDPETTRGVPEPSRADYVEDDPRAAARLADLKKRITAAGPPPRVYRPRWDAAANRFVELEAFGSEVLEDLWSAIDERYPAAPKTAAAGEDDPERVASEAFLEDRIRSFVGRRELIHRVTSFVAARVQGTEGAPGIICVTGAPGSGKSALLAAFAAKWRADRADSPLVTRFVGAGSGTTNVRRLLTGVWRELAAATGLASEPPEDFENLVRDLPAFLAEAAAVRPIVIVLDAIDQLEPIHDARSLRWLPETLPPRAAVVVSALSGDVLEVLRRRAIPLPEVDVGPLEREEAAELVQTYLREHLRKMSRAQIEMLLDREAARNPLYLRVALDELRLVGRYETLPNQIAALPGDASNLFQAVLARVEQEHGRALVRDFLSLIAAGRGGQPEEDLRRMLSPPGTPRLADLAWTRLFRSLAAWLVRRADVVDLYHRQLRDAVVQRYLAADGGQAVHARTADHLRARGLTYERALSECAWHLSQAGRAQELYAWVEDPEFRERRRAWEGSYAGVAEDIELALDVALARGDAGWIGRLGFVLADLYEDRRDAADVLAIHRVDPARALKSTRLLDGAPRFRALVALAHREAEIGQREAAEDRIEEALALRGAALADAEADILARLTTDLVAAGFAAAARLPLYAIAPIPAAAAAARAVVGADAHTAAVVLEKMIDRLGEATGIIARDTALLATVETLADRAASLADGAARRILFDLLDKLADRVQPLVERAAKTDDTIAMAIAALFGMKTGSGAGFRHGIQSVVAAARMRSGDLDTGRERLSAAVDACGREKVDPIVFGTIVRALRRIDLSEARPLYRQLVRAAGQTGSHQPFESILEALAADPVGRDLPEWIAPAEGAIRAIGEQAVGVTAVARASAWARAGAGDRADVVRFGWVGRFVAWNPLLDSAAKLRMARHEIELAALTGARGREWTRRALARLARWSAGADDFEERAKGLIHVAALAVKVGEAEALERVITWAHAVGESAKTADVLIAVLDGTAHLEPGVAATVRAAALESARALKTEAGWARVLARTLELSPPDEALRVVAGSSDVPADADARRRVQIARAAALARAGRSTEARASWLTPQSAPEPQSIGAARSAAVARAGSNAAWAEVLDALGGAHPDAVRRVVAGAAAGCHDARRLGELEQKVRNARRRWRQLDYGGHDGIGVHDLAAAWVRIGRPDRAARSLAQTKRLDDRAAVMSAVTGEPAGRALVARLAPRFPDAAIQAVAAGPAGPWRRRVMRRLHREALEGGWISPWEGLEKLARVAVALARAGRPSEAWAFLMAVREPGGRSAEPHPLRPVARANAYAALAKASVEIGRSGADVGDTPRRFAFAAAQAADEIKGSSFQADVCRALTDAWVAAERAGAQDAADLYRRAAAAAESMSAQANAALGWRWGGFATVARGHLDLCETESEGSARHAKVALRIASRIEKDEERDDVVARTLPALLEYSPEGALRTWADLATPAGRRSAARFVASRAFSMQGSPPASERRPEAAGQWLGPPQATTRNQRLRRLAPVAALAATVYLLAAGVLAGAAAVVARVGLSAWVSAAAALAVWLVGISIAWPQIQPMLKRKHARWIAFFLSPLAVPGLIAIPLSKRAGGIAPRLDALRARLEGPRLPRRPRPWETRIGAGTLRGFLRASAREAAPFDDLLAGWLAAGATDSQAADAAALLPPSRLAEFPAAEAARRRNWTRRRPWVFRTFVRLRRAVRKPLSKAGVAVTMKLFRPLLRLRARQEAARIQRANRLAVRGGELLNKGDFPAAEALLRESVRLAPEQPVYWNDWGIALFRLRRFDEAVAAQRRAVETGVGWPLEDWWCYNAAYTLYHAGRYTEAPPLLERVFELSGRQSEVGAAADTLLSVCRSHLGMRT